MNKERIMEAMNHIDPALIEAADRSASTAKHTRRGWSRIAVIAACLCLLFAGTAVAAELAGVHITGFFYNEPHYVSADGTVENVSGYTFSRDIQHFRVEDLSQELIELGQGLTEPVARSFSTWEQMEEFVGIKVMDNPVLAEAHVGCDQDVMGLPGGRGKYVAYISPGPGHAADGVTPMSGINSISLSGSYYLNYDDPDLWPRQGILIDVRANLAFASANPVLGEGAVYFPENTDVAYEEYVTPNGLCVLFTRAELPEGKDRSHACDYYSAEFTLNGVSFSVSATDIKGVFEEDVPPGLVEEAVKSVLDGFVCTPAA
ncbi:MAG: hypothetical protein HDT18_01785 [Oscillibacter sp.]|nr:hypothetical protein [Oscillibacter sp.]